MYVKETSLIIYAAGLASAAAGASLVSLDSPSAAGAS